MCQRSSLDLDPCLERKCLCFVLGIHGCWSVRYIAHMSLFYYVMIFTWIFQAVFFLGSATLRGKIALELIKSTGEIKKLKEISWQTYGCH